MKRVIIIAGHYGSGKTNIAVNMALAMKKDGINTVIADLDIVNPYFRTKDSLERLTEAGIKLISSEYANSNVDIPAIPQDMYSIVDDKENHYIVDLGGDDRGAYALGRYADKLKEENDYEMYFVFNMYRPLTPDAESALDVMREIEEACRMKFTAIINNSNIGELTDVQAVLTSVAECDKLSLSADIPVAFTCVSTDVYEKMTGYEGKLFSLELQKKII
ncbi:MAG: MinD/ParA family protein [Ruminococcaceae bacterium]|nr:MinD/ParA family protein [Oscillospiraceae bacterium]MBR3597489.1 hypothetical protein [Clostridia bacterium]